MCFRRTTTIHHHIRTHIHLNLITQIHTHSCEPRMYYVFKYGPQLFHLFVVRATFSFNFLYVNQLRSQLWTCVCGCAWVNVYSEYDICLQYCVVMFVCIVLNRNICSAQNVCVLVWALVVTLKFIYKPYTEYFPYFSLLWIII